MSARTKSTVRMICLRSGIVNQELPEEALRLLESFNDPLVAPEIKEITKKELDHAIQEREARLTTRRLKEERDAGPEPSVP